MSAMAASSAPHMERKGFQAKTGVSTKIVMKSSMSS